MRIRSDTSTSRRSRTQRRSSTGQFHSSQNARSSFCSRAASRRLSPYFLDAVAYAKKVGFYRILAATNGIRYAEDIEFCKAAKAAGQHGVYLQFDGTNEEDNKHRGVGNLFDVKLKAIENLASVGIKVTLVTTIVNSWNNDGIGSIVKFAAENIDKVQTIAFQPVSFTGRDEDISDADRIKQRYTLAGMTHDLERAARRHARAAARLVPALELFGVHVV